ADRARVGAETRGHDREALAARLEGAALDLAARDRLEEIEGRGPEAAADHEDRRVERVHDRDEARAERGADAREHLARELVLGARGLDDVVAVRRAPEGGERAARALREQLRGDPCAGVARR